MVEGEAYRGCPLLIDDGLQPLPSLWFQSLWARGSHDTARTYAQHLKGWWTRLKELEIEWYEATLDDIERYRQYLRHKELAHRSVNAILHAVAAFYRWSFARGFTPIDLFGHHRRGALTFRDASPIKPLKTTKRLPRYNSKEEFDAVLASSPRTSAAHVFRDELIAECGRYLGLRRKEIAGLKIHQFAHLKTIERYAQLSLDCKTTKGGRSRSLPVPTFLVHRIQRYINIYRKRIIEDRSAKDPDYSETDSLFVTATGRPIDRRYISASWHVAAKSAKIESRFHSNRHAMITAFVAASRRRKKDPRAIAQDIAGHAHESSTIIYDHSNPLDDPLLAEIIEESFDDLR